MKKNQKQQKQISSNDQDNQDQNKEIITDKTSQKQNSDSSAFSIFSTITKNSDDHITSKFYQEKFFSNIISVSIIDTNFESTLLSLHYGNFRLSCQTLFININQSIFSSLNLLGVGSFGNVYEFEIDGNDYAIKVIKIKDGLSKGIAGQIYRQYFLNCLADQLGVGPKVVPVFGYDILVSQNFVIFSMQKCSQSKPNDRQIIESQLFEALRIMHSVGFVHLDIKPDNIAFSEILQKHVFIDFGLSNLIPQKIGQKTYTSFTGTLSYCSQQMKKCYILRTKMLVNLYKNDIFSLKKSFQNQQNQQNIQIQNPKYQLKQLLIIQQINQINNYNNNIFIYYFILFIYLKYYIFHNNLKSIYQISQKLYNLPKSLCEILQNKFGNPQIVNDSRINNMIKKMKQRRYKFSIYTKIDQKIFLYINQQISSSILTNSFPIQSIIKLTKSKLEQIINIPNLLIKIFFFIDPFQSETIKQVSDEIWAHRKNLIEKIFDTFASKQQIEQSNRFPDFISLKTEFTLRFFMREQKNQKI